LALLDQDSGTYRNLCVGLAAQGVVDLVLPVAFYPRKDFLLGHILDFRYRVLVGVVLEDGSHDLVLRSAEPAFLLVL